MRALRDLLVAARGTVTVALRRSVRPSLGAVLGFAVVVGMAIVALSILALPGEDESGLAPPVAPDAEAPDQPASGPLPGPGTSGEPVAGEQPPAPAAAVEAAGDAGASPLPPASPAEDPAAAEASSTPEPDASGSPATAAPGPDASAPTTSAPGPATTTTRPRTTSDGGVLADLLGALGLGP